MQGEIIYQLNTYQKSVSVFINNNPKNPLMQTLQKVSDEFTHTQKPQPPEALTIFWNKISKQI